MLQQVLLRGVALLAQMLAKSGRTHAGGIQDLQCDVAVADRTAMVHQLAQPAAQVRHAPGIKTAREQAQALNEPAEGDTQVVNGSGIPRADHHTVQTSGQSIQEARRMAANEASHRLILTARGRP